MSEPDSPSEEVEIGGYGSHGVPAFTKRLELFAQPRSGLRLIREWARNGLPMELKVCQGWCRHIIHMHSHTLRSISL
jgi:hypothetical protein